MAEPVVIGAQPGGRNRRMLLLAGIAAALVLAIVVLPGLLFGGGGGGSEDFDFPPVAVDSTTTTTPVDGDAPAETFESFSDKNPFTPLVDVSAGETPPPDDATGSTSTIPPEDVIVEESPPPTLPPEGDTGETTTTQPGPPPPPARQPDRVSLLEVFTDQSGTVVASVRVNDVTYQVGEGDEFATSYRVLDLDIGTRCAQLLFGDDRFSLCEGEETLR
jgi:hypothetical protein